MVEPNKQYADLGEPQLSVQGKGEEIVRMDHTNVVRTALVNLAMAAARNPEWFIEAMLDLDAVVHAETRGMRVEPSSSDDLIESIFGIIGRPVVEMNDGQAITFAKHLEEAAEYTSNEINQDARRQFRLREAQKLVSAAAVQNTAAQGTDGANAGQTGTYDVRTLADRPTEGAPATHTGRPAQHSGRPIQDAPQA